MLKYLAIAFFSITALTGCAQMLYTEDLTLFDTGKWNELEKYCTRSGTVESLPIRLNYFLCTSQYEQNKYSEALLCINILEQKINRQEQMESYFPYSIDAMPSVLKSKIYIETGDYEKALIAAKHAVELSNTNAHPEPIIESYAVLGIAQAFLRDEKSALNTVEKLQNTYTGYPFLLGEEKSLAIVKIYMALHRYDDIIKELGPQFSPIKSLGMAIVKASAGGDMTYIDEIPNKFTKAKALFATNQFDQAQTNYNQLLQIKQVRQFGTYYWNILYDLAKIHIHKGELASAQNELAEAIDTIESKRHFINTEAAKIGFIGDKQALYSDLISLLVNSGSAVDAFEYVERSKSRALVDLLAERQNLTAPDARASVEGLKLLASLEQQYRSAGLAKPEEQQRLRSAISGAQADLRQKAPELSSLVTVAASKAADIQSRLAGDQTLLEYYGQGDDLYAFIVTRDDIKAVKLDGKGLEADVRAFRKALAEVDKNSWKPLAQKLYARLIAPVPGVLDRQNLVIVGHGPLHYLPWAALTDGQHFLVERVTPQLLPSASVMQFLATRKAATAKDMLLLGNPDLGDKAYDLPGAEAEAKAIKGIWPNSTMLMRKAATKAALQKAGQLFKIIHVAAHGEFVSDQPLASRLLLAPQGNDSGQLTAGDLYEMRLNADLVTLSACETGMGKVLSGDDVIGLTRGFLYAGANSIVASLWPVSDEETKFLMTSFYKNLKAAPKAEALRLAQLETKKKYPHPFFWSAFQLTGMGK